MITVNKQPLSGTPGEIRAKVEDLVGDQDDHEYAAGRRFRELALKLATHDGLAVSAISYDGSAVQELEVTLSSAPHLDPIVIDRSQPGDHCQITFERWFSISDERGLTGAVTAVHAILAASAGTDPASTNGATAR